VAEGAGLMAVEQVDPRFAHLDVDSEPQTSAEAFFMASQWGRRWSHWNHFAQSGAENAMGLCAQADAAEAQKFIAIGSGMVLREALAGFLDGLAGIENRLSEINDALRNG
jgi:hypothetical protein